MSFAKIPEIVTIGDSITWYASDPAIQGWIARLSDANRRKRNIVNMGLTTFNTSRMLRYLPPIIGSVSNPALYIIFLGTNDAVLNGPQTVPLIQFRKNMINMIKMVDHKVLLVTPPPVYGNHDRNINQTRFYRDEVLALAKSMNLPVVDTWKFVNQSMLIDGVHFNKIGHKLFYNELKPKIDMILGDGDEFPDVNLAKGLEIGDHSIIPIGQMMVTTTTQSLTTTRESHTTTVTEYVTLVRTVCPVTTATRFDVSTIETMGPTIGVKPTLPISDPFTSGQNQSMLGPLLLPVILVLLLVVVWMFSCRRRTHQKLEQIDDDNEDIEQAAFMASDD